LPNLQITKSKTNIWSKIGSRATFGMTVLDLAACVDNLMVLSADTSTSAGLDRFKKSHPTKYLDCGIAEQNMMGIAAGLASEGNTVITTTFAPFQTMRCCEQIKVNLGYMNQKVCMVGLASGLVLGTLGYTHCCIEDLSIMRSIPGLTVLSPADCTETVKATVAAVKHDGPVYIRLTGGANNPRVYEEDYDFKIGKAIELREGTDLAILSTGTMVFKAVAVARILENQGVSSSVINFHTIKPIDKSMIEKVCNTSRLIVTIEEHNIIGGLGSAVAEHKSTLKNAPPQLLLGLPDSYGKANEYNHLMEEYGLTVDTITKKVMTAYKAL
jgi:transketolase